MSSCSNAQSIEAVPVSEDVSEQNESNLRCEEQVDGDEDEDGDGDEDEDEDEDVDFNPFLKGAASPEASSSLSSEVEGLDVEVVNSGRNVDASSAGGEAQACVVEDREEEEEELAMESENVLENECGNLDSRVEAVREKDDDDGSGMGDDVSKGEKGKCAINVDDEGEDAICKRTRARYSLASFTLDELETFLQETDDDDDLQNVDDEEEYRKFLTAVLYGREGDGELTKENGNAADDDDEDEDEENDADFELELEELLDSDVDLDTRDKNIEYEGGGWRPKTRQNRKSSGRSKKNLGQRQRSLRPLLPVLPMGSVSTFYTHDICTSIPGTSSNGLSSTINDRSMSGFTAHQIGQLHHLIYEHMQLLIQVYSLCVLDHSRQHVASQVQKLISEMLHKRDETLVWKNIPYPNNCFCPSVPTGTPISHPTQNTSASCFTSSADAASALFNSQTLVSPNVSPFWVPSISGPVLSVLDVAPLRLLGRYMEEIDSAVQRNRRRYTETISNDSLEKVPLFPLHNFPLCIQANSNVASGMGSAAVNVDPSSPSQPKKSLAAAIVESTKQTVALVPREIANTTQRFFPLFNPALFPHKPPIAAVTNRVLFTDAEDELLALGLMEYNTDWKAIQQRFLPTKSKHQIFVRQKNRCSSKAPENPIKAVRRMKTSPLTAQEISCIQEGLKAYKGNLMAVWKFVVPHRDPTLLPRQWRTAIGTQKSYKLDEAKKEKRRLYDSKRRERKKADMPSLQSSIEKEDCQAEKSGEENNSADVQTDNAAETYVHEAFLADWRPGTSSGERTLPSGIISREANNEWIHDYRHKNAPHSQIGDMHRLLSVSKHPQNLYSHMTTVGQFASGTMKPNQPVSHMTVRTFGSQSCLPPYRARRSTGAHLVKLAPDLPPVNLPRSVRVVSQSAFRQYVRGASYAAGAGGGFRAVTKENIVSQVSRGGKSGTINATTISHDTSHYQETLVSSFPPKESQVFKNNCAVEGGDTDSEILKEKSIEEGGDTDSDLQMHPLLFQAPEDGRLPYYSLNSSTSSSSSYGFLSGNQPQLHLTLSHTPHLENQVDGFVRSQKKSNVISRGIDFHPLMQRTDHGNNVTVTTCSTTPLSVGSAGNCNPVRHSSDSLQTELQANTDQDPTGTKPFSPYNAANELDLEIHLSSTSIKEKDLNSTDVNQHSLVKARTAGRPFDKNDESSGANCDEFVSVGDRLAIPEEMDDQSQPDIEMEQEELSDSDEESEENVEFECEEMADSEGEEDGSACEQISEMQNKDVSSNATKRPATAERDDNIQIHRIPSLELGLSNQGIDDASNCSWLSLDTYRAEHEESEDVAVKELASSRPVRSCKKPRPRSRENAKKNAVDMAQQLSLGPLAPPPVRKPRKRVCRPNLNIALTVENYNSDS